jgi:hypothetical protein
MSTAERLAQRTFVELADTLVDDYDVISFSTLSPIESGGCSTWTRADSPWSIATVPST